MDVFFVLLIFLLGISLLYVLLNIRIIKNIEQKFDLKYKQQIQSDIKEFYRELESYSAIFDNKILQLKKLNLQQTENLKRWDEVYNNIKKTRKGKQIIEALENSFAREDKILDLIKNISTYKKDSLLEKTISKKTQEKEEKFEEQVFSEPKLQEKEKKKKSSQNQIKKDKVLSSQKIHPSKEKAQIKNITLEENKKSITSKKQFVENDEEVNVAEELLLSSSDDSYKINKRKITSSSTKTSLPSNLSVSAYSNLPDVSFDNEVSEDTGESKFLSFVAKIGKAVSPFVIKDKKNTVSKKSQPVNLSEEINLRKEEYFQQLDNQVSQSKIHISKEAQQAQSIAKAKQKNKVVNTFQEESKQLIEKDIENDNVLEKLEVVSHEQMNETQNIHPPKESQEKIVKQMLTKEEMQTILKQMEKPSQIPMSLKILMNVGFTISEISQLSGVSQSQLEATRKIYNL